MTRLFLIATLGGAILALCACTDSKRASGAATWGDRPADITCWTYGTENFRGRSTGKVEYDEGGRVSFVDASNGRYTTVEGDCRVVYLADGDAERSDPPTTAPAASPRPSQPAT